MIELITFIITLIITGNIFIALIVTGLVWWALFAIARELWVDDIERRGF